MRQPKHLFFYCLKSYLLIFIAPGFPVAEGLSESVGAEDDVISWQKAHFIQPKGFPQSPFDIMSTGAQSESFFSHRQTQPHDCQFVRHEKKTQMGPANSLAPRINFSKLAVAPDSFLFSQAQDVSGSALSANP